MKKFNLSQWQRNAALAPRDEVEIVTTRIETAGTDIAPAYHEWRDLGFALAEGLGEEGRAFYHRLSRFYAGYAAAETDKQFTACLRSRGHGIKLNTFFFLARRSGVDITTSPSPLRHTATPPPAHVVAADAKPMGSQSADKQKTPASVTSSAGVSATQEVAELPPAFPDEVYAALPRLLAEVVGYGISPEDTDILLLGALTTLSSCLTQVYGIYGQRQVYANLYLFITARASAGKGRLTLCRHLVDVVHMQLRKQNKEEWEEYRRQKAVYDANKRKMEADEPVPPPVRMLFMPANSSATALFQTLNDNEGRALMFETEGDTLTTTFRSEHGNYSDGLRKAFHHETIAYNRRKEREYVEISAPRLSVVLSGTPRQVEALIPDAENGLFSRFIFYCMSLRLEWNDVFAGDGEDTLDYRFLKLGGRFFNFYTRLQQRGQVRFSLSMEQRVEFNRFFATLQEECVGRFGIDLLPTVRRLGLVAFRILMTLSTLRLMDYEGDAPLPDVLTCRDDDFRTALTMSSVLLQHAAAAFGALKGGGSAGANASTDLRRDQRELRMQSLIQALPPEFDSACYHACAKELKIPARTAERYVVELCNRGLVEKLGIGTYRRCD